MDRGRSRDISPLVYPSSPARPRATPASCPCLDHHYSSPRPHLSRCPMAPTFHASPLKPPPRPARDLLNTPTQPVASSSRIAPPPPPPPQPPQLRPQPPQPQLPPPSPQTHPSPLSSSPSDTIPRTQSSSSVFSDSSEHTPPGPFTPPDAEDEDSAYALQRRLEYYDSPPSPPRTLKDQMQDAYALDNMLLAKILLLKLQGIEVTGEDDPRIAAVRDEDFSSSFVPEGGLKLDPETEARLAEAERRERELQRRRARDARLRQCEQIWETSARRHRGARERVVRAKEDAERARRDAERQARQQQERERMRKAEAARAVRSAAQLRIASGQPRQLLSYDTLRRADGRFPKPPAAAAAATRARPHAEDSSALFMYDIMPSPPSSSRPLSLSPPTSCSPPDRDSLSLQRAQRELAIEHAKSLSRSVAFTDVLVAMHGPLFADDVDCPPYSPRGAQQTDLLAILLEPAESVLAKGKERVDKEEQAQRTVKAKKTVVARVMRTSTADSVASTSSASSSTSTTATRTGSWFSFGSKSSMRSASTTLTSPSSSPIIPTKPSIILSSPLSASPPSECPLSSRRASSKPPPPTNATPALDHPLALPVSSRPSKEHETIARGRPLTRDVGFNTDEHGVASSSALVHRMSRSVSTILDFAAQFQRAYVKATMFSAGLDLYARSPSRSRSPDRLRYSSSAQRSGSGNGLKPQGYRASAADVSTFAVLETYQEDASMRLPRTLIPLCTPTSPSPNSNSESGRALSPHTRVFPIPPPLPRSPFRPPFAPGVRLSRARPVANPVLLRLQALHNMCAHHAIAWQRAREGSLAAGKEKMVGVAWEGIGRSGLGWEVATPTPEPTTRVRAHAAGAGGVKRRL